MESIFKIIEMSPSWVTILYAAILLFFLLPIVLKKIIETLTGYKKIFGRSVAKKTPDITGGNIKYLEDRLNSIQEELKALDAERLAEEISELRKLIS